MFDCSKYTSIPYMAYLSKMCISTKKMVTGLAHKKSLKRVTNKQQTNIPNMGYLSTQI